MRTTLPVDSKLLAASANSFTFTLLMFLIFNSCFVIFDTGALFKRQTLTGVVDVQAYSLSNFKKA